MAHGIIDRLLPMALDNLEALIMKLMILGMATNSVKNMMACIQARHRMFGLAPPILQAKLVARIFKAVASTTGAPSRLRFPIGTHHLRQILALDQSPDSRSGSVMGSVAPRGYGISRPPWLWDQPPPMVMGSVAPQGSLGRSGGNGVCVQGGRGCADADVRSAVGTRRGVSPEFTGGIGNTNHSTEAGHWPLRFICAHTGGTSCGDAASLCTGHAADIGPTLHHEGAARSQVSVLRPGVAKKQ